MEKLTAVVIGATGMVGAEVVRLLLKDKGFLTVRILVRRQIELNNERLEIKVIDFNDSQQFRESVGKGDVLFSCIGTTNKNVKGDKDAYRKIDFDIPFHAATLARDAGFKKFLMISSAGANVRSSNFYLKLKGEVEEAISKVSIPAIAIFRPGFLMGHRKEKRTGEGIVKFVMKIFSFVFIGSLKKYRPVEAEDLAKSMIKLAKEDWKGVKIIDGLG